jgi:hypothetical protein
MGHSDDSVTLVLDAGMAFTGDLPPPHMATDETLQRSWAAIQVATRSGFIQYRRLFR